MGVVLRQLLFGEAKSRLKRETLNCLIAVAQPRLSNDCKGL
jgi:hypothetical protein